MISERVDIGPAAEVVGRQGKGLDVSQSSRRRDTGSFLRSCQRWDAFDRVEAQDQMVYTAYRRYPRPVSFGRAAMEAKTTHVGYSANDKHMSDQSLRLLPSKFTVDSLVSVVGGLGPVDLSER